MCWNRWMQYLKRICQRLRIPEINTKESIGARARICKRLWRPGIDSEDSIPPAYVAWRAGTTNRVVVPARQAGNRFLNRFTNTVSGYVRLSYRSARLHRLAESIPWNRCLGSLNVYKYGLWLVE
jgi:hypothetical protein